MVRSHSEDNIIDEDRKLFYYAEDMSSHIDCVFLSKDDYMAIFKKEARNASRSAKKLSVVKVSFKSNGKKRSVHRRFDTVREFEEYKGKYAAVNYSTLRELTMDEPESLRGKEVELSKGCKLCYYWNNPIAPIRASFRLGVISLILGAVSVLIAVSSFIFN